MTYRIPRTPRGFEQLQKLLDDLKANGYEIRPPKAAAGYVTRKCVALISTYQGNYGEGIKIEMPRFDTTGLHTVIYAIIPETDDNTESEE